MEKGGLCEKHGQPVTMFCHNCKKMICGECVELHIEEGHKPVGLLKFAETIMLPQLQERGTREEGVASMSSLLAAVKTAKDREAALLFSLTSFADSLTEILRTDPSANIKSLVSQLTTAIKDKDMKTIIRVATVYLLGLTAGDAEQVELRSLVLKAEELATVAKATESFCTTLSAFVSKRLTVRYFPHPNP